MNRICENCGKEFCTPPSQVKLRGGKYCSRKCYDISRTTKKICLCCGVEFSLGRKHRNNGKNKFCSTSCHSLYDSHKIEFVCKNCGKIFKDSMSKKRIFCSKDCKNKYRIIRPKPIYKEKCCDTCGKIFIVKHFMQRFCSRHCSSYWLSNIRNKGTNHPRYKGNIKDRYYYPSIFYKIRKKIIKEANGKCLICEKHATSVHHVDYDKTNNSTYNLVLLCNSCHAKTNTNREEWEERINHLIGCW